MRTFKRFVFKDACSCDVYVYTVEAILTCVSNTVSDSIIRYRYFITRYSAFLFTDNLFHFFLFSVLAAEIIKHYFPRMVDVHNYTPAASSKQKLENWYLLNR